MTAVIVRKDTSGQLGTMPGWSIVADLTPRELVNSRALGVLRRWIAVLLALVVLLCGAGYAYAVLQTGTESDSAATAALQTSALTRASAKYAGVTQIETTLAATRGQIASVMVNDVDLAHQITAIRTALPASMSIGSLTLTLTPTAAGGTGTTGGLDTSGRSQIGTVTISGSGRSLDDLPAFVDRLVATRGFINVLPSSNLLSSGVATYSVTFALTDQLYSHRYDVGHAGGK